EHAHAAHAALRLTARALHAAERHADRVELVHEQDAGAGGPGLGVFSCELSPASEERHDDERVDAHPHAAQARGVDVDEWKLCLRGDDPGEERLSRARLT